MPKSLSRRQRLVSGRVCLEWFQKLDSSCRTQFNPWQQKDKMAENSENWQEHPYLVKWVDSVNKWAKDYEIYEFISSDEQGYDQSGRFAKNRDEALEKGDSKDSLVWTLVDSSSEINVLSKFSIGAGSSWATLGWFLGRIPHSQEKIGFDFLKKICSKCEGAGGYFDSELADDVECLPCVDNPIYIDLVHKASGASGDSDQKSVKASGSEGILSFTASLR